MTFVTVPDRPDTETLDGYGLAGPVVAGIVTGAGFAKLPGVHEGDPVGDADGTFVAVEVGVLVEVLVDAGVPVGVSVAVGIGPQLSVVICSAQPPFILPISMPASSRT